MDEETLRLILEVEDLASPALQRLRTQLRETEAVAWKLQQSMAKARIPVDTGDTYKAAKRYMRDLTAERQRAVSDEKRRIKEVEDADKRARAAMHASAVQALKAEERLYKDQLAAVKAKNKAQEDAEREWADFCKKTESSLTNSIVADQKKIVAATKAAARERQQAYSARGAAAGSIFSGASDIVGGVGRVAGTVLSFGQTLLSVGSQALTFGKNVVEGVIDVLKDVERVALVGAGSVAAVMGITAKAGLAFNQFKENTLLTLQAMTGSAKHAGEVFKYAFQVAIPAKFTFEEVLDGFRSMEAFGIRVNATLEGTKHTVGELAVALAQGMDKPLQQVTRFLGNLSQGRLLLQQAAPLGLARPVLQQYGVEFDTHGSAKDRTKLLDAAMHAIADMWGNLLDKMANTYEAKLDSMVSMTRMFSGKITEGLFESLKNAYGTVGDLMKSLVDPKTASAAALVAALKTPFDLVGAAIENAASHLPEFVNWLSQILTKERIIGFLAEVIVLVRQMWSDISSLLKIASGGKGLVGIWETFRDGAIAAINFVMQALGGLTGGIEYLMNNGDKIWQGFLDGAKKVQEVLEVIVGLMVLNAGSQLLGGLGQIFGGANKISGGLKGLGGGGTATATAGIGFPDINQAGYSLGSRKQAGLGGGGVGSAPWGMSPLEAIGSWIDSVMPKGQGWRHDPGVRKAGSPDNGHTIHVNTDTDPKFAQSGPQEMVKWLIEKAKEIGHGAIGGALDFGKSQIPDSLKNLGIGMWDAVKAGSDKYKGYFQTGDHQGQVDAVKGQLEAMTGKRMGDLGADDPRARRSAGRAYLGQISPEEAAEMIKAYESRDQKLDPNDKAEARKKLLGLYNIKLGGDQDAVAAAGQTLSETRGNIANGDFIKEVAGQKVNQFEKLKTDQADYWKAVQEQWKTEAQIEDISKDGVKAVFDRIKEANKARLDFVDSQINLLPDSQRAAARATQEVAVLESGQRALVAQMAQVKAGTEAHLKLETEYNHTQAEINKLRQEAAEQAANQAFDAPKRRASTLKKLISMLPQRQHGAATLALIGPQIQQAYAAAQLETDPVKKQQKILEVADMFADFKESRKKKDPFQGAFDKDAAAERHVAVQRYQEAIWGGRHKRGLSHIPNAEEAMFGMDSRRKHLSRAEGDVFAAMSPFAPSPGGVGGASRFSRDRFTQIILNLGRNPSDEQITNALMRALAEDMDRTGARE